MIYLEESYTLHYSKGINIKISAYHSEKEESDIIYKLQVNYNNSGNISKLMECINWLNKIVPLSTSTETSQSIESVSH